MERYYKYAYATGLQNPELKAAMCNPIFDFINGSMVVFGLLNIAGWNLIWGSNPVIKGMGYVQVLAGGTMLGIKYMGGVCR